MATNYAIMGDPIITNGSGTITYGATNTTTSAYYPSGTYTTQWWLDNNTGNWHPAGSNPFPTEWTPVPDPIPAFADVKTVRANLQKQLELLQSFEDGLVGEIAERMSDSIFFLRESIESLNELIGD